MLIQEYTPEKICVFLKMCEPKPRGIVYFFFCQLVNFVFSKLCVFLKNERFGCLEVMKKKMKSGDFCGFYVFMYGEFSGC